MENLLQVLYSEKALKQLKKISRGDKINASRIIDTIERYAAEPDGNKFDVKILKGKLGDFKRLRVGVYRIIFDQYGNVLYIYQVKHRQEAYDD